MDDPDSHQITPPENTTNTPGTIPPPKNKRWLVVLGIVALILVLTGIAFGLGLAAMAAYTRWQRLANQVTNPNIQQLVNQNEPRPSTPAAEVDPEQETPLFTGQLKRLNQNLALYKTTPEDELNSLGFSATYYSAGQFARGQLKGYTRIIAIKPALGPGDPSAYILATTDYKTYVLDDPEQATTKYPEDDWQNPYNHLDKSKISRTEIFDTELPKSLALDKKYALYFERWPTENVENRGNNQVYDLLLNTDQTKKQKLASPASVLGIYFQPYTSLVNLNELPATEKAKEQLKQQYILGDTAVTVVDQTGLPAVYSLTTLEDIKNYLVRQAKYEAAYKVYQTQVEKYNNQQLAEYPDYPKYAYPPTMGFTKADISGSATTNFFTDYQAAIPGGCAFSYDSKIMNISSNDLEAVGQVAGLALYRLKDKNHPLLSLAYNNKMDFYGSDPQNWTSTNPGVERPALADYVSKNPLLFVKDYWDRWVALGEYDIMLPGGCGKPVIYLYPEKPTTVSVKFNVPVQFTTNIPTYGDGWQVLASPNGALINLKPEQTVCNQIDSREKGSEYAAAACQSNTYPYLYWAGNVASREYPEINRGWVVGQNDLGSFIKSKLIEVGLNEQEQGDFLSYWLPELQSKAAPYYKISFLQTKQLNEIFPMTVTPTPETSFRIFLDWQPLIAKPQTLPKPQTLDRLVRKGFTLVEWGGIKKP